MVQRRLYTIFFSVLWLFLPVIPAAAVVYVGRVTDESGAGLMYATVYLQDNPVIGTATNADGFFSLSIPDSIIPSLATQVAHQSINIVFSCIGYQTTSYQLPSAQNTDSVLVTLPEQPILLTTTTVEAKKTHQSKRKKMATLLHEVYVRLEEESPKQPVRYQVVSDLKMEAKSSSWGMEQMIASVIQIPSADVTQPDSIQFFGECCKRYCNPLVRQHADNLLSGESDKTRQRIAQSIDSGTIVHRELWKMSQLDKADLLDLSDELARWKMSQPDNQHLLLTYARRRNLLGIVKATELHSLLVDNSASLQTSVQDVHVQLFLPFSIRIKDQDLGWLNLLNMDDERIEKFKLKKGDLTIHFETRYIHQDGILLPQEKIMHVQGVLEDNKKHQLPCELWGSQHITTMQTEGVTPIKKYKKGMKVERLTVPIY